MKQWRRLALTALTGVLAVVLAACGSSGNSPSSDTAASSGAARSAAAGSAPAPKTAAPTKITITSPLPKAPTAGKTFFWLQCELPICEKITQGVKAATTAAGWKYENLVFKATDPGGALDSAIQRKPDAIGITGIPSAAVKTQLKAAAAAGIPVVTCSPGPEEPSEQTYRAICNQTTEPDGTNLALWAIHDSGGKAHIVSVTVPSYPSLKTTTDGTAATVKKYCSGCSTDVLDVTVDDLAGGQIAAKVVAYLQSHPDVNYVLFTFADLETGVPQALKAAGYGDKVKLIGDGAGPAQFKALIQGGGPDAAWVAFPSAYQGWLMVDAALRTAGGGTLPAYYEEGQAKLPTYIVDTAAAAEALGSSLDYPGPAGYQDQFKALWKVG